MPAVSTQGWKGTRSEKFLEMGYWGLEDVQNRQLGPQEQCPHNTEEWNPVSCPSAQMS